MDATGTLAIPGIELGPLLGRGAFGSVFRGRHVALDVPVAVKLVDGGARHPAVLDRAVREARIMARLDHPNVVRIHDAGRLGGAIYLVLELMDGGSLEGTRRLAPGALADLLRQLLSALQCLHDARIVHRDVKPANCLRRQRDGRVKLADLGLAADQATLSERPDELTGTLPFIAPELFLGAAQASARSDLYALGMTALCLALDADPFPTGSLSQVFAWATNGPRPDVVALRPDLPGALAALLARLSARDPEDRPESAAEALALLAAEAPTPTARVAPVSPAAPAASLGAPRIGPWVLGEVVYESSNWRAHAATHARTGAPARLARLQPAGPLAGSAALVLGAAERASTLDHPGVLPVLDWGRHEARPYVVTPPSGRTLEDVVRSGGALPELEALAHGVALAEALAYLHGAGLVYQMVEPGSVNVAGDGRAVRLGWPVFCVARGTPAVDAAGRPQRAMVMPYAAPEVFAGAPTIEPAVDLYGLGEVLYYLLAGRRQCAGETPAEVVVAKTLPAPPLRDAAPEVTAPTAALVAALLDADPLRRPASAADVRDALARVARRLRPSPGTAATWTAG